MANRKLVVEIIGDSSSLERAFGKASASGSRLSGAMRGVGKAALLTAGGAGIGALFVGLQRGIGEFKESEKVAAQTAAALKSTRGAAGVTAKQIDKLSQSLSNMSGVDDEAIQSGANLLLTFTNIQNKAGKGNKIFDRATQTILDMSVALGQDTKSSAIQLGKALNDPIKGVTALRRVGVSFTADQLKQIKVLVDSGKTMEAQKVILAELAKEFGGSAKAAGDTFGGSINKLKNTFDNLAGSIVGSAAPALQKYVDHLNVWLSKSENQEKIQRAVTKTVRVLGEVVSGVAGVIKTMAPIIERVVKAFGGWKHVIELLLALKVASWLSGVAGGLLSVGGNAATAKGQVGGLAGVIRKLPKSTTLKLSVVLLGVAAFIEFTRLMDKYFPAKDVGTTPRALNSLPDWAKKQIIPKSSPKVQVNAALGVVQKALGDISKAAGGGRANAMGSFRVGGFAPAAALAGGGRGSVFTGDNHFYGVQNLRDLENEIDRRARSRPAIRRGAR